MASPTTIGWYHFGNAVRTIDILDNMKMPYFGASGFAAPLPARHFILWLQETATGTFSYRLNLIVTPVPLPPALLPVISPAAVFAGNSRQRLRTAI
jgi:hypothetical protein